MASKKDILKNRKEKNEKPTSAAAVSGAAIKKIDQAVKATKKEAKPEKADTKQEVKKKGLPVSFRLDAETVQHLKELCMLTGRTSTGWIAAAIEESYQMRKADIATMKKLQAK